MVTLPLSYRSNFESERASDSLLTSGCFKPTAYPLTVEPKTSVRAGLDSCRVDYEFTQPYQFAYPRFSISYNLYRESNEKDLFRFLLDYTGFEPAEQEVNQVYQAHLLELACLDSGFEPTLLKCLHLARIAIVQHDYLRRQKATSVLKGCNPLTLAVNWLAGYFTQVLS